MSEHRGSGHGSARTADIHGFLGRFDEHLDINAIGVDRQRLGGVGGVGMDSVPIRRMTGGALIQLS